MKQYPNAEDAENTVLNTKQNLGNTEDEITTQEDSEIVIDVPEIELHFNKPCSMPFGKVSSAEKSADYIREIMGKANVKIQEHFILVLLDRGNNVIGFYRHSKGGISGTVVDIKLLMSVALKSLASNIIISHNHPSDGLVPSQNDFSITRKIHKAAFLLDIVLLDHIIITQQGYYSFSEHGHLDDKLSVDGIPSIDKEEAGINEKESKAKSLIEKAKHLKF